MVALWIVIGSVLAVAAVVWSDVAGRDEEERETAVGHRVHRYEELAAAADRLRSETGREPSVRDIYAALEPDEPDADTVIDLRERVRRIKGDAASESSVA